LRVVLDATPLSVATGGIRRYTEQLTQGLRTLGHQVLLASDQPLIGAEADLSPKDSFDQKWWSWGLPRQLAEAKVDVFHGSDFCVPWWKRVAAVMMIHDLTPWLLEDAARLRIRDRSSRQLRWHRPDMIVTPSEGIRLQVIEKLMQPEDRVVATPLAAAAHFCPSEETAVERFLLFVGTTESRKSLNWVADLAQELQLKLKVVGRKLEEIPASVDYIGTVDDAELLRLYRSATALVAPSQYEGFGLPILEAMQSGCPVVASRIAAHEEVGGEAALLAETRADWKLAVEAILQNRKRFQQAGLDRAASFTWEKTAQATVDVFQQAMEKHG
jgi:glycosyltransferase involved in cell wall biosynthesis